MKTLGFFLFALFSQQLLAQTTWYVGNSGSNSNNGTSISTPFQDINFALAQASCGDSLYVLDGTYHEKIVASAICPENNRIILQGDVNQKPLIIGDSTATSKYAVSALGSGFYFRNFRMTSPYPEQCSQSNQVIVGIGDHFTFDEVIVFNSGYDGIKTYGDCNTNDYATNWKIINSEVFNCGLGCPPAIVNGDGIDLTQCHDCSIENTLIKNNMGHQVQIKLEAKNVSVLNSHIEGKHLFQIGLPGAVPQCDPNNFNADSVLFVGNTIVAKGDTSEFVFKLADVHSLRVYNNTIVKDSIANINLGFICFGGCSGNSAWTNTPSSPVEIKSNIFVNFSNTSFDYGPDTAFFDPFNIISTDVDMDYNLFYDAQVPSSGPATIGSNSIVGDPLFCDYPYSFELELSSPCINSGDPNLPNDPDNSINDIGAKYYQTSCTNEINDPTTAANRVKIFPNPSYGPLIVQSEVEGNLKILSINGTIVLNTFISVGENLIDMENIDSGLYLIVIEDRKGLQKSTSRIIKH